MSICRSCDQAVDHAVLHKYKLGRDLPSDAYFNQYIYSSYCIVGGTRIERRHSKMDCIDETIAIVRASASPELGWSDLLTLFQATYPSEHWGLLSTVHISQDSSDTQAWLLSQIATSGAPQASGIYLGLDTLNMDGSDGYNIELALTDAADPMGLESDWVYRCPWYGQKHLIRGLRELKAKYDQPEWSAIASEADYLIPLGYSGLVLTNALEQLRLAHPILAVWGFHDGDLFFLGRQTTTGFERICQVT